MCYFEKTEYRIRPVSGYKILRGCPGCGGRSVYGSTGNFRVNANGRQVDVWLIYQCEKCGHTYNLAIYERVRPKEIPGEEYRSFLENDGQAALRWGIDKGVFARNRAEIDWEDISYEVIPVDGAIPAKDRRSGCRGDENQECQNREMECQGNSAIDGKAERCRKKLLIIFNPYELKIRADKVAAEVCHITRSKARQLAKEGKISLPRNYIGRRAEIEIAESPLETLDIRETERNGKAD